MLELLGVLGGAVARLAPLVIDFFKKKQENSHELALLTMNVELERQRGINRAQEIQQMTIQGEQMAWANGLVEALKTATPATLEDKGSFWLNLLNGLNVSVRPILTYWWCIVTYTSAKIVLVVAAIQDDMRLQDFAPILLTDFDRGVVGSIIGFWFVDRALRHGGK
jgi:hypothetical protein